MIGALLLAAPPAWTSQAGDAAVCNDRCTNDRDGSFASCHRMCMSQQELNRGSGSETMRPMPRPPTLHGAIAIDAATLITGSARDHRSRAEAEQRGIAMCRQAGGSAGGCKVAVWAHNSCLALSTSRDAAGKRNRWGYAWSDDAWVSKRNATAACRKDGGTHCQVATSFCTG